MNILAKRSRASEVDPLALNSTTMHQYYNTVQSDVASEHEVDSAMSRRQAMALQRRQARPVWPALLGVVVLLAGGVYLLS